MKTGAILTILLLLVAGCATAPKAEPQWPDWNPRPTLPADMGKLKTTAVPETRVASMASVVGQAPQTRAVLLFAAPAPDLVAPAPPYFLAWDYGSTDAIVFEVWTALPPDPTWTLYCETSALTAGVFPTNPAAIFKVRARDTFTGLVSAWNQ